MTTPRQITRLSLLIFSTLAIICGSWVVSSEESPQAPNWVVGLTDGRQLSLYHETGSGQKVVAIFWASWCSYCRELLPKLSSVYAAADHQKVKFVAMNIWEDGDPAAYLANNSIDLPLTLHADNIAVKYGVKGTPGVFVVGPNNKILYQRQPGESSEQVVASVINALSTK
ncbi:MAG: thiol-disulfide isomerase/thioredoxin [Lentisphaeria bacterium]|jgi:thiol-disulfide isomerase/thioredoxin